MFAVVKANNAKLKKDKEKNLLEIQTLQEASKLLNSDLSNSK